MSGKNDGCNYVNKSFKDVESLKREEWHRRRLLRLEQVRQQSKDVATLVRQKVQTEREKQLGLVKERVSAQTQQWQVQKLKALHKEYESTLKNVGKGHSDAAYQPNFEAIQRVETEKIMLAAQKRGQEALQKLREEEASRRKAEEQRRHLLSSVRSVEEARSAAVVALPCPESTIGIRRMPSKTSVHVTVPTSRSPDGHSSGKGAKTSLPEWPKRLWPHQVLPLGINSSEDQKMEKGDSVRAQANNGYENSCLSKDKTPAAISSQGDTNEETKPVHKAQSVNAPRSSKTTFIRNSGGHSTNSDVKLYDFTSTYQSHFTTVSGVVEKVKTSGEVNAKEVADREFSVYVPSDKLSAMHAQIEKKRSKEALQRVQAQRDYKDLMGSLSTLAKQNAVQCAYSYQLDESSDQDASKENQLIVAVENLLPDAEIKTFHSIVEPFPSNSSDASLIVSQLEESSGSGPRLNLGEWQPLNETLSEVNSPKSASPIESNITEHPPSRSGIIMRSRPESSDRDNILRSLVQRINNERQLMLQPNQQSAQEVEPQSSKSVRTDQLYIKRLEQRVLEQRQALEEQRSEVKRLDASIIVPVCIKRPLENVNTPSEDSSLTHESITIEESPPEKSSMSSLTPSSDVCKKLPFKKDKNSPNKKNVSDVEASVCSPMKDKMMYSMDVSLSSIIMDQTENDSSGSKSLSLHGVQVVVKVCGKEESPGGSSLSGYADKHVETVDISSERVDNSSGVLKSPSILRKRRQKKKSKDKSTVRSLNVQQKSLQPDKAAPKVTGNLPQEQVGHKKKGSSTESKKPCEKHGNLGQDRNVKTEREVPKMKKKSKGAETEFPEQPASTSTSYLSPPDRVLSSLTEDIKTLIDLARANANVSIESQETKPPVGNQALISYINRLLAMSRESIDQLNVSCSEISTPTSSLFQSSQSVNEATSNLIYSSSAAHEVSRLSNELNNDPVVCSDSQLKNNESVDNMDRVNSTSLAEDNQQLPFSDQESLVEMTKRCNQNISILTKMIEEVRAQGLSNTPIPHFFDQSRISNNQSKSPLPLDSTAYMSPPPQVLEWANIAQSLEGGNEGEKRMSLDPYGAAVMQLVAEIREQTALTGNHQKSDASGLLVPPNESSTQGEASNEMINIETGRPKPPVAFWRNIERCNVTSPTEPHELSTIPELATTLPESIGSNISAPVSPLNAMSAPSSPGTPPDVIAELMRRNLLTSPFAWAKKMNKVPLNITHRNSKDSELSSGKSGTSESDICASKETNSSSMQSQNSNVSTHWQTNVLMSPVDLYSSPDEVEGDLRRMGIGWMGAMLRKTKEAGALSSTSSSEGPLVMSNTSEYKDLSDMMNEEQGELFSSSLRVALGQSRGHSTPIKPPTDLSSSNGSQLI